jgi:hypothetical protein
MAMNGYSVYFQVNIRTATICEENGNKTSFSKFFLLRDGSIGTQLCHGFEALKLEQKAQSSIFQKRQFIYIRAEYVIKFTKPSEHARYIP